MDPANLNGAVRDCSVPRTAWKCDKRKVTKRLRQISLKRQTRLVYQLYLETVYIIGLVFLHHSSLNE